MSRRRFILAALAVLLLAVGGVVAYLLSPAPPSAITREAAAQVRLGMARAEVERIMGGPMRNEMTGQVVPDDALDAPARETPKHSDHDEPAVWLSDTVQVVVYFDREGRAVSFSTVPVRRSSWAARLVGAVMGR